MNWSKKWNKIAILLVILGVLLMLYPLYNYFYSNYQQDRLKESFTESIPETVTIDPGKEPADPREFTEAQLEIPAIDLVKVVLKGTSPEVLKKGPGWYEESVLPGQGNTAIAGHLNTDGSPFRRLPELKPGDAIKLVFEGCCYEYQVEKVFTVASNDWSVIGPCGYSALTLTTCVAGDSRHRRVVRAAQVQPPPVNTP